MFFRILFYIYLVWILALQIVELKGCNSKACWIETRKLVGSQLAAFGLSSKNLLAHNLQIVDSKLATCWRVL